MTDNPHANEKIMGLSEHLGELRSRLVKAILAVLVLFCIAMGFANQILEFLQGPLKAALPPGAQALHFTSPLEPFIAQIKVAILISLIAGCPVWLYQFWRFIEPALYQHEKKYILPFTLMSVLLFMSGVAFCFFIMLPFGLSFLINMGMETASAIITISDYISVIMVLILAFGLVFETPLILVLLAMLDLIEADTLAKNRKTVLVIILILGAMLTPPDPISQVAMALPTYLMFEVSIWVIRLIKREKSTS